MKKLLVCIGLFLGLSVNLRADIVRNTIEEPVSLRYVLNNVSASTNTILIKLSDTSNYPHKSTGFIDIGSMRVMLGKVATSTGTVKIGVVTRATPTGSDIKYFFMYDLATEVTATAPSQIMSEWFFARLRVKSDGTTPFLISNDTTLSSSVFSSTSAYTTAAGTFAGLAPGDVVMTYTSVGSNPMNINIELKYSSEKQ